MIDTGMPFGTVATTIAALFGARFGVARIGVPLTRMSLAVHVSAERYGPAVPAVHAFLMTDIVGSTRATRADQGVMREILERHDETVRAAIVRSGGTVFKHTGDGVCAVFDDPAGAVRAAVDGQRSLLELGVQVRMGIDVGVAYERGSDYFGLTLNRCARVMSVAHGGQVLVTLAVEEMVQDLLPRELSLEDVGLIRLRDFDLETRLFQVRANGLPCDFPAVGSERVVGRFPRPARRCSAGSMNWRESPVWCGRRGSSLWWVRVARARPAWSSRCSCMSTSGWVAACSLTSR